MRMRLLVLLSCAATALGTGLVTLPTAHAATQPPGAPTSGNDFLKCTTPEQRYCVVSAKRNGAEVADYESPVGGTYKAWIRFLDDYTGVGFGVDKYSNPSTSDTELGNNTDTYQLRVNTGTVQPREMDGTFRDATFLIGRYPSGDWNFTITFRPSSRHTWSGLCDFGTCGDDSTQATEDRVGWASGMVGDLSGLPLSEAINRTGSIRATSAQYENTMYDPDTDSIVVDLSNPHRTGTGTVITDGTYEAFLPNAYMINDMSIPDPSTVTLASFVITKPTGSSATFSLKHETRGIRITITGISYSSPRFRLRTKPTVPGRPRAVVATKVSTHKAKVRFAKPLANGGRRIDVYQARCHRSGGSWHYAKRSISPIYVGNLPRGAVYCQVRAHNVKGYGNWSAADRT